MKRYAVAPQGQKPKAFLPQEEAFLHEANIDCNIFIEVKANDIGSHACLVLYSTAPLDPGPIPFSAIYGDYYVFFFEISASQDKFKTFKEFILSCYPQAQEVKFHPAIGYMYNGVLIEDKDIVLVKQPVFQKYILYYHRYIEVVKEVLQKQYLLAADVTLLEEIRAIMSPKAIMEHFPQYKSEMYYDASIDRVVHNEGSEPYGDALTYAFLACGRQINETKRLFRDKFGYNFFVEEEQTEEEKDEEFGSIILYEIPGLITRGKAYYYEDKQVTDFLVRVKYVVTNADGEKQYFVDLIGDIENAEDVEFPNVFSKSLFKQRISKYGDFHYSGGDAQINMIHKAIATAPVPNVESLLGYGYHKHLLAAENIIYDFDQKVVFEKEGKFYFNKELKTGYTILDATGSNLVDITPGLPRLDVHVVSKTTEEYLEYFKAFYKDDLGEFLFIYSLAMMNAGRMRQSLDFKFPYLVLHGMYGSGKSSLSDIIKRIYNIAEIEKAQIKYGEISAFAMTHSCSYRHGLPLFITEFKELEAWENKTDSKMTALIAMYDRSTLPKGRADQSLVHYNYDAFGVIDGEELPKRSAMKSRSVIIDVRKTNNALGTTEYHEHLRKPIIHDLFSDATMRYYDASKFRMYQVEAGDFFTENFPKCEPRLKENFSALYSLALLFDVGLRDTVQRVLSKYIMIQHDISAKSFGVNEILNIVKKYSRQMIRDEVFYYDQQNTKEFRIRLDALDAFMERYRIKTSIAYESVKGYFPCVEYREELAWGIEECAVWKMGPDFPVQFLFHPNVYQDYKATVKDLTPNQ